MSGLQMLTGAGEWVFRPVTNRNALQISEFVDQNPKGFGFLQRDRDFDAFRDDSQHWERRPSLWIEPIGDWGAGFGRTGGNSVRHRKRPEHHRLLAPEDAHGQGPAGGFRLSPVLVLVAAVQPAARRGPELARRTRRRGQAEALPGRFSRRWSRRSRPQLGDLKANLTTSPGKIANSARLSPAGAQVLPGPVRP